MPPRYPSAVSWWEKIEGIDCLSNKIKEIEKKNECAYIKNK